MNISAYAGGAESEHRIAEELEGDHTGRSERHGLVERIEGEVPVINVWICEVTDVRRGSNRDTIE